MSEGKRESIDNSFEKEKPIMVTLCLNISRNNGFEKGDVSLNYSLNENVSLSKDIHKEDILDRIPEEKDEDFIKRISESGKVAKIIEDISFEYGGRPIELDFEIK